MKKIFIFLASLLLVVAVVNDIKKGTLPRKTENKKVITVQSTSNLKYVSVKVKRGDTVLSIYEHYNGGELKSIDKIISDFIELNDIDPVKIKENNTYKIPIHSEKN
jgi:major membrane immunogen (membrane-anchored lipoprotein)